MRDPRAQPFASLFNLDRPGLFQLTESTHPCVFDQSNGPQPWAPKYDRVLSALFEHEPIKLDQHHPSRAADPVPEKLKGAVMRDQIQLRFTFLHAFFTCCRVPPRTSPRISFHIVCPLASRARTSARHCG